MKKIFLTLLIAVICIGFVDAQSGPRGKKPKKNKGNHSNGRTELGFASATSVFYDVQVGSPKSDFQGDVPGSNKGTVASTSFMTPSGWGSTRTFAFATVGGTPHQPYSHAPDGLAQVGFGTGDYRKTVSVVGIVNVNDVSKFDNFSYSVIASRAIGKSASITAGALHLFADAEKTDAGPSYYVAYSQALTNTKFSYTIGVGSGRFYENSEYDIDAGKKAHGTAVFANVCYNVTKNINVAAEWTGLNLALASSIKVKEKWPVLSFGVTDITRLSGSNPVFYASVGQALVFNKRK